MFGHTQLNIIRFIAVVLFALLLPGATQVGSQSALPAQEDVATDRLGIKQAVLSVQPDIRLFKPATLSACPAAPAGLPNTVEREDFCVFYSNNNTAVQAGHLADHVEEYWDRYVTDFGFLAPLAVGKLEVHLLDIPGDCNGCGNCVDNAITVYSGCFDVDECLQLVAGHELFHRVQYSYHSTEAKWLKEGSNRVMEDNSFDNLDNWPAAVTQATCPSFNKTVDSYIASASEDITSDAMKYLSGMWWKYFTEQYGSTPGEPQLGMNAILEAWEAAAGADDVAAVNNALAALGAGTNFNTSFRRFAVANWTKDLSGLPDASYNYVDEEQVGNPDQYGPVIPEPEPGDDGIISVGDSATWNNQAIDNTYGIRYYSASTGASCPLLSATFHKDLGPDAFYHIVTQKGTVFASHEEGSGTDWTQSFINDGITRITAIIGTQEDDAQVDVTLACANPVVDIKLPNNVAVAYVGPFDTPGKFLAQVQVTNGASTGPVVAGLTNSDFKAQVNGVNAAVTAGGFIQEQYWLEIEAPVQAANGAYDLEIVLEEPGTSTEIASDTNADSVTYTPDHTDHVLVVDRSGSMGANSKLLAAQDAANFYVDITRNSDGLAVVPFQQDVAPPPFDMQSVDLDVRDDAKTYIRGLTPGTTTSIGDGLQEAADQRTGSPTGNPQCSFVLLSDGMENTPLWWADVQANVVDTHCPVTSIAFGPDSNETLMQDIATATGGASFYNDVYTSGTTAMALSTATVDEMALELGGSYEYAQSRAEGRQRLFHEKGVVPVSPVVQVHHVLVDNTASEVLFALDWNQRGVEMELQLEDPQGKMITLKTLPYTFADFQSGHLGWRISKPIAGEWLMLVTHHGGAKDPVAYQVLSSAHSRLTLELLLPDRTGRLFFTGNRVPIYAFLSAQKPISDARVEADVTAPDGTLTTLRLFDDGQHGDGAAGDGFYGNIYTRVNQAIESWPSGEDYKPISVPDEGAYRVRVRAYHDKFRREALGSFAVLEGEDQNGNRLPDPFEKEHNVSNPDADPDLDSLDNLSEYLSGTDPNNSDTDGGGENDGSEVLLHKQDPLDPRDDQIEAPDFFRAMPETGAVLLTYDVKKEYSSMLVYRATARTGPWILRQSELPLTGFYSDKADNGTTYFYRLIAIDSLNHRSAVLSSEGVKPSADPLPPMGLVIIDHGARKTLDLDVILSFAAYNDEDIKAFDDIAEVQISNEPFFTNAKWQAFEKDVPWQLAQTKPNSLARVYVRFRDAAGNQSVGTEVGAILYEPPRIYLPVVGRH